MELIDKGYEAYLWNKIELALKSGEHKDNNPFFNDAVKHYYGHLVESIARSIASMYGEGATVEVFGITDRETEINGGSKAAKHILLRRSYVKYEGVTSFKAGGMRFKGEVPLQELRPEDYDTATLKKAGSCDRDIK